MILGLRKISEYQIYRRIGRPRFDECQSLELTNHGQVPAWLETGRLFRSDPENEKRGCPIKNQLSPMVVAPELAAKIGGVDSVCSNATAT
jgi:hypothetical protein